MCQGFGSKMSAGKGYRYFFVIADLGAKGKECISRCERRRSERCGIRELPAEFRKRQSI